MDVHMSDLLLGTGFILTYFRQLGMVLFINQIIKKLSDGAERWDAHVLSGKSFSVFSVEQSSRDKYFEIGMISLRP